MLDIDKIRLLTGDRAPATEVFTDADIQEFLDQNGGVVKLAAATLLEAWAALYTANPTQEGIGDYSYSQKAVDNMLALAKRFRDSDAAEPAMDYASMDLTAGSAITEEED